MRAKVRMPTAAEDRRINAGIAADPDNPEWSDRDFVDAKSAAEMMPPEVYASLTKRRGRPPGSKPAKVLVTLRVEPDVLAALRATGAGWQSRASTLLAEMAQRRMTEGQDKPSRTRIERSSKAK